VQAGDFSCLAKSLGLCERDAHIFEGVFDAVLAATQMFSKKATTCSFLRVGKSSKNASIV